MTPEHPARRLGRAIAQRRGELRLSQAQLAEQMSAGLATLKRMEQAATTDRIELPGLPRAVTRARLEEALRWHSGSVEAVWNGGQPMPLEVPPPTEEELAMQALIAELEELKGDRRRLAIRVALAAVEAIADSG